MKATYALIFLLFFIIPSFAQFQKNEKLLGGSLGIFSIKEKDSDAGTGGGPFGNTSSKEIDLDFRPEFSYMVSKNSGLSIFGEISSSKYTNAVSAYTTKGKGYAVGLGFTKYQFFTKGFGLFARIEGSYAPSWTKIYDTSATIYPKDKYYLTNFSLLPGLFYRFSRHFSLQAIIGRISYDYLRSTREDLEDTKKHYQFSAGFSNIIFGAYYIFK